MADTSDILKENVITRIRVQSWEQARELGSVLTGFKFRGQSNASWSLNSTLERTASRFSCPSTFLYNREDLILRIFRREVHHYVLNPPDDDETVEWIALMQHYGAPTRLLDCTHSFYIAAFFAFENATDDAAVWAFNADSMQSAFVDLLATETPSRKPISSANAKILKKKLPLDYNAQLLELKHRLFSIKTPAAVLIEPFRKNERLRIQQGLFLCPLDLTSVFDDNLFGLWGSLHKGIEPPLIGT
jgi:hypothetical protein